MDLFDEVATTYNITRKADERICASLIALLDLSPDAVIADIAAGTGNYSLALARRGLRVRSVEPSAIMRRQAHFHPSVEWYEGYAENIPLADSSVDGVICTLAIHYFTDLKTAFQQMIRISGGGPIVILTFDPRVGQKMWFAEYFAAIWEEVCTIFRPIEDIVDLLSSMNCEVEVIPFRLPHDLTDNFALAGWRDPVRYLDEQYRANIISFQMADKEITHLAVEQLRHDLSRGRWHEKFQSILDLEDIDAGYRFIKAKVNH